MYVFCVADIFHLKPTYEVNNVCLHFWKIILIEVGVSEWKLLCEEILSGVLTDNLLFDEEISVCVLSITKCYCEVKCVFVIGC